MDDNMFHKLAHGAFMSCRNNLKNEFLTENIHKKYSHLKLEQVAKSAKMFLHD